MELARLGALRRYLLPEQHGIFGRQCIKDAANLTDGQLQHEVVQFSQMRALHQGLDNVLARHALAMHHALNPLLFLQHFRYFFEGHETDSDKWVAMFV